MSGSTTRTPTPARGRPAAGAPARGGTLVGTPALIRLILRRDRIRIPAWTVAVVAFLTASAASVPELYPTSTELQARGDFVRSPVLTIFSGPGFGADDYTVGAMVANEYLLYGIVGLALMSSFMVVRHTRAEEEAGRAELVRAAVVGRHAALTAALIVTTIVNLLIGAMTALALAVSLTELSLIGSWSFGLSMAASGIVFAAIAGVASQVAEHARGATGISIAVLAGSFVLRAVGDVGAERPLSWMSPVGWAQSTRAYVDERWWPLLLPLALAVVLVPLAYGITSRRDVAAGLVPPRPGPARASRWLGRPSGVAVRLQRANLIAWGIGLVAAGVVFGSLVGEVENFLDEAPQLREFFGVEDGALVEGFLATVVGLLSLLATAYAVAAVLRLRGEEGAGRAEPMLATAITRSRWAGGHVAVAMGGGAVVLIGAAVGSGVAAAIESGDADWTIEMLGAALAHVPALWFVAAVVVALHGLSSRAGAWGWLVLGYAALVELMGDTLDLPDGARSLSPFHHLPDLPGGQVEVLPLIVLTVSAGGLLAIGWIGLRRRDIVMN